MYHRRRKREREHEGASSFKEGSEGGVQNSDSYDSGDSDLESETTRYPWTPKNTFNPALEEFLTEVYSDLFNPTNRRKIKDNLCRDEKQSFRKLSRWNRDRESSRIISVEDKGSSLVVDWKDNYLQKNLEILDPLEPNEAELGAKPKTFRKEDTDPSLDNARKVKEWANKWEERGVISEEQVNWICND